MSTAEKDDDLVMVGDGVEKADQIMIPADDDEEEGRIDADVGEDDGDEIQL